jgi:creatinine amidohydrolase/Fe(II)-dependent formamide hydrolase-like protein
LALEGDTLVRVVRDLLFGFAGHAAKRVAVIDAHYENGWFLLEACDQVGRELARRKSEMRILRMLCWDAIPKADWQRIYEVSGPIDLSLAHAGVLEASPMLYLAPETVDLSRDKETDFREFPLYDMYPPDPADVPPSGTLSSPQNSTAELGQLIIETMSEHLAGLLAEAFGMELRGGSQE